MRIINVGFSYLLLISISDFHAGNILRSADIVEFYMIPTSFTAGF